MKREPVITAAGITGGILSFLAMAVALGWISLDPNQMGAVKAFLIAAVPLALTLAGAWYARRQVTPVAAPRTKSGVPAALVPLEGESSSFRYSSK